LIPLVAETEITAQFQCFHPIANLDFAGGTGTHFFGGLGADFFGLWGRPFDHDIGLERFSGSPTPRPFPD